MGILDDPTALSWAELDATYALKPDNGARAVGQGELVLNVRDFGAKGDGVTDDTAAIQAALDTASANGCTVVVPRDPTAPISYRRSSCRTEAHSTSRRARLFDVWPVMRRPGRCCSSLAITAGSSAAGCSSA